MKQIMVAVIGGGPGGYVTAIRLKQYGIDSVVFEKERLGGVCLNRGCIPTKALVKVSDFYGEIKEAEDFGINVENISFDFGKIYQRKDAVVEKLVSGVEFIFNKKDIPVIKKQVNSIEKKDDGYLINYGEESLVAKYVIIATGSVPKELGFMPFDGEKILSSRDILNLKELPKSLAIIGGGVIGCEFASIFSQLGTKVNIIEFLPRLVATEDVEISKRLNMALKRKKIKIKLKTGVVGSEIKDGKVTLKLSNNKEETFDKVLVSVGRAPQINFDFPELKITKTGIEIDEKMQTNLPNVFSIGDVTGKMMLAHTASKQGLMVASIINEKENHKKWNSFELRYENIPRCIFTNPEIGSVGLTEEQAKEKFEEVSVGKFPFSANGKSLGLGNTFGFAKTISDKTTGKLLGMHIIGPQATEIIAQGSILLGRKTTAEDVDEIVFAHPTLSEVVMESVEDLNNLSIHKI